MPYVKSRSAIEMELLIYSSMRSTFLLGCDFFTSDTPCLLTLIHQRRQAELDREIPRYQMIDNNCTITQQIVAQPACYSTSTSTLPSYCLFCSPV